MNLFICSTFVSENEMQNENEIQNTKQIETFCQKKTM